MSLQLVIRALSPSKTLMLVISQSQLGLNV